MTIESTLVDRIKASPDGWTLVLVDDEPHRVHLQDDVLRFVGNPIVRKLLDTTTGTFIEGVGWPKRSYGLNQIIGDFRDNVRALRRLYIEIGYSLDGFLGIFHQDAEEYGRPGVELTLPEERA